MLVQFFFLLSFLWRPHKTLTIRKTWWSLGFKRSGLQFRFGHETVTGPWKVYLAFLSLIRKGVATLLVSARGLLGDSQEMTYLKSTWEFVIHIFKLRRGPENLVRGQEEKKMLGNGLQRVKISIWFWTILAACYIVTTTSFPSQIPTHLSVRMWFKNPGLEILSYRIASIPFS